MLFRSRMNAWSSMVIAIAAFAWATVLNSMFFVVFLLIAGRHSDRVRVRVVDGRYVCERAGEQGSNVLSGMAAADGLALLPDGPGPGAGDEVRVILL